MYTAHDRARKLVGTLDAAWMEFQESYAGLSDDGLMEPGVTGAWSVRDLIAHVTWWEEEAIRHLPLILDGGRPPRYSVAYGGIDAFNALMTERKAGLSLDEVRGEFAETHRRLVDYLLGVPPERIVGDSRFRRRLRLDTYGHYPIHTADIRRWRESSPSS
ncbi:MAG: hypothetical protein AVDCRST_MAG73-3975 [uncultured Thermomicrobiales bacterium]|uniref:DinB-like domain-containing protein n=1 Tax=uncultured Thermomicrobiales bacterium TaxID=1645740 RepID=A0A6J4UZP4_9BACT|nr:MAG: hypothetical protein AVDCRST_MAG73-3975 [uncultured Thermomicrobiales bacterium]